jgi:hypothetical protein
VAAALVLLCAACAGTPPPPPWVEDREAAFPQDRYIAVRGASGDRGTVREAALRELSRYFQTQVSSETSLTETFIETFTEAAAGENGVSSQATRLDQHTLIQTETELFAVRYTDPWRNPALQMWEMIAYIDRNEAWAVFAPRLTSQTAPFMTVFDAAEADPEPMRRFFRYRSAAAAAANLPAYLDFAETLDSARAAAFAPVRAAIAALPQRLNQAKAEASLFVDCSVDLEGIILTALTQALGAEGFPVSKDRASASAVCLATVTEGMDKREAGTFYSPVLTVGITGKTGTALVSMTVNAPRQSAVNPEIARRRAYTALAGEIQAQFHRAFETQIAAQLN